MPTPAYTGYADTKPLVADTRQTTVDVTRTNLLALRDAIVMGREPGWTLTATAGTGTAEQPQFHTFAQGVERLRGTLTWSAGFITAILWEWSNDSGGTYVTVCSETRTYDGSSNSTGGANSSWLSWLYEWVGKFIALRTSFTAHAASSAVHGLLGMAFQAASSVAITGGAVNASVGLTTPAEGLFTRASEQFNTYAPGASAGQALDWSKGGSNLTNNGTNAVTFTGISSARISTHLLRCSNLNLTTFPAAVTWGLGGKPSIAGQCSVMMVTTDGGTTVEASVVWRAV
jgi:hypothetical protein